MRIVYMILYRKHGIDIMSEETLSEYCQRKLSEKYVIVPYREVHKNHPCTLWTGDSAENYEWLWQHGMELCFEYTRRYNKIHKCQQVIMDLDKVHATMFPVDTNGTPHPQCMPDEYKSTELRIHSNTVRAYRRYYVNGKRDIAKWEKSRVQPEWYTRVSYKL